jgi:hypothetical protein
MHKVSARERGREICSGAAVCVQGSCVIIQDGHVIGSGSNRTNETRNVTPCCFLSLLLFILEPSCPRADKELAFCTSLGCFQTVD